MNNLDGVILAGGKSVRFGADKALVRFRNKPLISSIYDELAIESDHVCIISDTNGKYKFLNIPVYKDIFPGFGPVGGIYTALNHTVSRRIFITPCDIVLLSNGIISILSDSIGSADAAAYSVNGILQPLPVLLNTIILEKVQVYLRKANLSVKGLLNICNTVVIPAEYHFDPEFLKSGNTREEFLRLSGEKDIYIY